MRQNKQKQESKKNKKYIQTEIHTHNKNKIRNFSNI